MSRLGIGIVDYGVGNHMSVWRTLYALGYRCKVTHRTEELDQMDLLLLPGVGAFPAAMAAVTSRGLADYLRTQATAGRPLLGICLGMQMLAESSSEFSHTPGLGLIPGKVKPLCNGSWHIGWNIIETDTRDPLVSGSTGASFYFNHSFAVECPQTHQIGHATHGHSFPAIIRRDNILGVQFHPEKSQGAGRLLLRNVIGGLCGG